MPQLSYSVNMKNGKLGAIHDLGLKDCKSFIADVAIPYGTLVTLGSDVNRGKSPSLVTDLDPKMVRGVAVAHHAIESQSNGLDPQYPAQAVVNTLRKGRVWVKAEDQITAGVSTVNVRYAGVGTKGAFRGTAVTNETAALAGAKWLNNANVGELALLEVDL